jgi:hypothetical protein
MAERLAVSELPRLLPRDEEAGVIVFASERSEID